VAKSGFVVEPILLKHPIVQASTEGVMRALRNFGADSLSDLKEYPPKRGGAYRRTGTLGRRWAMAGPRRSGDDIVVQVGNTTEYTGYVQGFQPQAQVPKEYKQTRVASRVGWSNIDTVLDRHWPKARQHIIDALT
jgi:hypothetical protein